MGRRAKWGLLGNRAILAHDAFDKFGGGEVYGVATITFGAQPEAGDEKAQATPHEAEPVGVDAAEGHGDLFFSSGPERVAIQPAEGRAKRVIPTLFAFGQAAP